jgi:hypothetical protein
VFGNTQVQLVGPNLLVGAAPLHQNRSIAPEHPAVNCAMKQTCAGKATCATLGGGVSGAVAVAGAFQCLLLITSPLLCTTLLSSRPIGSSASLTRSKNSSLSAMLSTPDVDLWLRSMVDLWSCNSPSRKHYVPLVQQEMQRTQPTRPITFQTASRGACHQRAVVIARSSPMTDKEAVERVQDAAGESMWSGSGINALSSAGHHGTAGAAQFCRQSAFKLLQT